MSILRKLVRNSDDISDQEYQDFFTSVFEDRKQRDELIVALTALSAKPLNAKDMSNFVRYVERDAPKKVLKCSDRAINIVGTGGGAPTFNISTTSTFVAAAAGATVLKSGSYSYNSKSGSLDLLANLGINLKHSETALEDMVEELNIGFVPPQMYAPILRRIAISIMPLNLRDIAGFINKIGPLLCPIKVAGQICGVSQHGYIDIFTKAMQTFGMNNSMTVWAEVGLDEFSAIGKNQYALTDDPKATIQVLNPLDYGMHYDDMLDLAGGEPDENVEIMKRLLTTNERSAAVDTVALNAAHVILLGKQADNLKDALAMAHQAIFSGAAFDLLQRTVEYSHDTQS
ncbi:anthranilate phosphoribosyltransferase [Alteromonas sp. a30]|uniref:anthranilate phosphoribosyltransferase n=1 Tax=Alteromonas sp. a30 TaxID=2730917 RepID=UPI00227E11B2|nr:anthranilate phosphoribosyltransferase [Alteromonas sp. a30]MCY7296465.1 anthranilate phosphoribosyltransferase [Alteromonas sp. a30]